MHRRSGRRRSRSKPTVPPAVPVPTPTKENETRGHSATPIPKRHATKCHAYKQAGHVTQAGRCAALATRSERLRQHHSTLRRSKQARDGAPSTLQAPCEAQALGLQRATHRWNTHRRRRSSANHGDRTAPQLVMIHKTLPEALSSKTHERTPSPRASRSLAPHTPPRH